MQQLKALGFKRIVVADLEKERLEMARELGADVVVQSPTESVAEATPDQTGRAGADLVIKVGIDLTASR